MSRMGSATRSAHLHLPASLSPQATNLSTPRYTILFGKERIPACYSVSNHVVVNRQGWSMRRRLATTIRSQRGRASRAHLGGGRDRHFSSYNFSDKSDPSFVERLVRAWRVLFPPSKPVSNAEIAKQRLRMILISDRCSVSDDAKRRIVDNIVGALSEFVEIESEEDVQLSVSADSDLGTVYSVSVPVRRVKPEYQDFSGDARSFDYRGFGDMRPIDIRFEYPDFQEGP